jgi:hypothetical protein
LLISVSTGFLKAFECWSSTTSTRTLKLLAGSTSASDKFAARLFNSAHLSAETFHCILFGQDLVHVPVATPNSPRRAAAADPIQLPAVLLLSDLPSVCMKQPNMGTPVVLLCAYRTRVQRTGGLKEVRAVQTLFSLASHLSCSNTPCRYLTGCTSLFEIAPTGYLVALPIAGLGIALCLGINSGAHD